MRESFQNLILHLVLTGIFFLCVTAFWFLTRRLFGQFRALSKFTRVLVVVMVTVAALLAQKPDGEGDGDDDESGNYSLVENTIHAYEPWTLRGAADDWFILNFTNNWVFPHVSNHWTRCVVLTSGQVWDTTRGTNRLVAVGQQMSAVPDESIFTYELTDDNSYLLTWSNFFLNRDTNQPITASIELKRNGGWIATSNEVSVAHSRILPFAHNGFGQDADWVRANFTNAEEILFVGYTDWVDAQVGYNLTNGLYKFVATFAEDPPEAVNLTVGDLSVAVTNAGDYAFLLEKGRTYRFWTDSAAPPVFYWAVDDVGGEPSSQNAPPDGDLAHWTSAGGNLVIDHNWDGRVGRVWWTPRLWVTPDVPRHLWPDAFPITFVATLLDIPAGCGAVTYEWHGGNEWLTLTPNNGVSARASLNADNLPNCGELSLSVTARFTDKELTSYLTGVTVGTVDPNGLSLSVSAPEVVFLNDDERTNRFYHVTVTASCPFATNATVSLTHTGADGFAAFEDAEGETTVDPLTTVVVSVAADGYVTTHDFWFKCSQIGCGRLEARTVGEGARQTVARRDYTVIEPIAELVTHETTPDGRQVNPSRLVYGTNAWLSVSYNGNFPSERIVWRVVSGPARLMDSTGCCVCVEATASEGEAVVEACFGDNPGMQPRFVLPIVRPRTIPVHVYYVRNQGIKKPDGLTSLINNFETANTIFSQIGVCFQQAGEPQEIADPSFAVLPMREEIPAPSGGRPSSRRSEKLKALAEMLRAVDGVKILYVHSLTNTTAAAFTMPDCQTVVMGKRNWPTILAHELGHILGLEDIYVLDRADQSRRMPGYFEPAFAGMFGDDRDWGADDGRGFYTSRVTHGILVERLLMNGIYSGGADIPSGTVLGWPSDRRNVFDVRPRKVGAAHTTEGVP